MTESDIGYSLDDPFLRERLQQIIDTNGIQAIVETGLDKGRSTERFVTMAPFVYGIDNVIQCVEDTRTRLLNTGKSNWCLLHSNSPDALKQLSTRLPDQTLYFLDAHWQAYWPLLDEIRAIRPSTGVIVIHDFQVPGTNFGCDSYQGQVLNYDYVKEALTSWSPTHRVEYSTQAAGSYRGAAFIFPR